MQSPESKASLQFAGDFVALVVAGFAGVSFQITGTWSGTVVFEGTVDGATWVAIQLNNVANGVQVSSTTTNGAFTGACAGLRQVRARMSVYASGGAIVNVKAAGDAGAGGGSGGGGGGGAVTIADGADVAEGTTTDAAITSDSNGTVIGFLRGLVKWAYERMPGALGQTDMAGSLPVVLPSDQTVDVNIVGGGGSGGTSSDFGDPFPAAGTAVGFEDQNGDMAPVVLTAAGEIPTSPDLPPNAAEESGGNLESAATVLGTTTDATVQGNNTGTINARLRGLSVVLNDVWDAVNNRLNVFIENATLAVTQSGSWVLSAGSAIIGSVIIDRTTPGTTNTVAPIAGQDGVQGGAGAATATTQRVAIATDANAVSQGTAANLNAQVVGNVAHDAADSGNPVKVGGVAATSLPSPASASDRVNLLADVTGRPFVRHGAQGPSGNFWEVQHVPAANTQATASQAAAGAGIRNVCTGFTVTLASSGAAPTAVQLTVAVIDGATGTTSYLWRSVIALPAVAGAITSFVRGGLWMPGTANTAMTIEFSAPGGANTIESVSMEGTTVEE